MTTSLAIAAVLAGGLLAGLSVDRTLVALPAWRKVGPEAWAAFSRDADLGNGLVVYPLLGVGAPLLSLGVGGSFALDPGVAAAGLPILAAALISVAHLLATARAAPNMAKIRSARDRIALQQAFDAFERWQRVRAILQSLTFAANIWALVAVLGGSL